MSTPTKNKLSSPQQKVVKKDGRWVIEGRPRETFQILSHKHPTNAPGKSIITLLVTFPPNAATPPHTHGGAAVTALGLRGKTLNQMNDDEPAIYGEGEVFYESPGCHHVRGENVSETEEASFYAVFVVDDEVLEKKGFEGLLVEDAAAEEARELEAKNSA